MQQQDNHEYPFLYQRQTCHQVQPIKQLIRNGRSASLQRTFKKSFTSFSHSTRNKTRDGLIRVRNIRALNGRFNTSITRAEERFSRNAETDLICRLLLEKKT